jgi:hypothetical protein
MPRAGSSKWIRYAVVEISSDAAIPFGRVSDWDLYLASIGHK